MPDEFVIMSTLFISTLQPYPLLLSCSAFPVSCWRFEAILSLPSSCGCFYGVLHLSFPIGALRQVPPPSWCRLLLQLTTTFYLPPGLTTSHRGPTCGSQVRFGCSLVHGPYCEVLKEPLRLRRSAPFPLLFFFFPFVCGEVIDIESYTHKPYQDTPVSCIGQNLVVELLLILHVYYSIRKIRCPLFNI